MRLVEHSKAIRPIIKEMEGIMSVKTQRNGVIWIQGGVSFKVPYEKRLNRQYEILDKIAQYAKDNGLAVVGGIDYNFGRIVLKEAAECSIGQP